jgi:replication factor C subunit 3/5
MTSVRKHTMPLTELLRPRTFEDITLPKRQIDGLQQMLETENPMNMLFYGPPGMGKTSAARIFLSSKAMHTIQVDGSLQGGVEDVRSLIDRFASCLSFTGGLKLCFIDEADFLSQNAQASLRGVIERYASNCRFIMAVNDLKKIMPAIQSRMLCICFKISRADRPAIQERIENRLAERLGELGVTFDRERLNAIVVNFFPDFRQIVNRLEFEFCH